MKHRNSYSVKGQFINCVTIVRGNNCTEIDFARAYHIQIQFRDSCCDKNLHKKDHKICL